MYILYKFFTCLDINKACLNHNVFQDIGVIRIFNNVLQDIGARGMFHNVLQDIGVYTDSINRKCKCRAYVLL